MSDEVERIIRQASQLSLVQRLQLIQQLTSGISAEVQKTVGVPAGKSQRVILPTDKLTHQIIGCAMASHTNKGPGFRENTYQRDLDVRFAATDLLYAPQKFLDVFDSVDGRKLIGYYIPDFIVENRVIVEIKALSRLDNSHVAQVIGYLAVSGCEVGLLLNFGERSLEWQRILPPKNVQAHKVNRQWLFVPEWLRGE